MKVTKAWTLILTICLTGTFSRAEGQEMKIINALRDVPYREEVFGKRKLAERDELLLMQAALKPGQRVPPHRANSNVHLLILEGEVVVDLDGNKIPAAKGDLVPVAHGTPMYVVNEGEEKATFLIIKTPHPRVMGKKATCAHGKTS